MKKAIDRIKRFPKLLARSNFRYFNMKMAKPPYWVRIKGKACRIQSCEEVGIKEDYREIIVEDQYDIFKYAKSHAPRTIADIGANIGIFSKLCGLLFPKANIYSYEPHPGALYWLWQNADGANIKVFPVAVHRHSGEVPFNTNFESTIGAMVDAKGNIKVKSIPPSEVCEGAIDLLKMDCEGSEWEILEDGSLLDRTKDFFLEYHLLGGRTTQELRALVEKGNHKVIRIKPRVEYLTNFGFLWSTHR